MIGFFDSGIGGLSIFREVHALLPEESTAYIGDQAHLPYGPRSLNQIRHFTTEAVRFLIKLQANPIVIACNTASGAALQFVRKEFPEIEFVGLVPAVKPAAESTKTGRIGVLATPGTFRGRLYIRVKNEFAADVIVYQDTVPGLVEQIEGGFVDDHSTREILETALKPMLARNIDRIVLGCTHYPFAEKAIKAIVGDQVQVIEPGAAVARRVQSLLPEHRPRGSATHQFFSTGDTRHLTTALHRLLDWSPIEVTRLEWLPNGKLAYA